MKNIIQSLKVIILGLILALGLSYAFAWTAPTASPPGGNVSAPVNVSNVSQIKTGNMSFLSSLDSPLGYFGKIGIGTVVPNAKLTLQNGDILLKQNVAIGTTGVNNIGFAIDTGASTGAAASIGIFKEAVNSASSLVFKNWNGASTVETVKIASNGNLTATGVICDSTGCIGGGGGGGGGSIPNGYVEEYENSGEDVRTPIPFVNSDTCDGNKTKLYSCLTNEDKSCTDTSSYSCDPYGGCSGESFLRICRAAQILRKYDSSLAECSGTGKTHTIPDGSLNDGGGTSAGDSLEVYCFSGVARWCLSGEACPWRGASSDTTGGKTCSRAGLGSDWMATAYDNFWINNFGKLYTNYYCNLSEQKYGN